jgi:DNA mismatch repair protein MutS
MRLSIFDDYKRIKDSHPDSILCFRVGDFYELFYADALTVGRLLGLSITTRRDGPESVPMAGVPCHACEIHLQRIIRAGLRIATIDYR